ncbi:hypothetical protein Vi05172_g6691 [Venturia inaequalis]|nr:hypothetical protein Vi05172_g6691 [Venturia inaequalis]
MLFDVGILGLFRPVCRVNSPVGVLRQAPFDNHTTTPQLSISEYEVAIDAIRYTLKTPQAPLFVLWFTVPLPIHHGLRDK